MFKIRDIDTPEYAEYILSDVAQLEKDGATMNYYSKNDSGVIPFENSFRYAGKGCEAFGLAGDYSQDKKAFISMFKGLHPKTGKPLVQNVGKEDRRIGFDGVFTPSKQFSVLLAKAQLDGNKKLEEALLNIHRESVAFTLANIEKNLTSRSGKEPRKVERNVKMFVFQADHFDTRPTKDGFVSPNIHTHNVIMNYVMCEDGKIRAVEAASLNKQISLAGSVYDLKQAELLQAAGLNLTVTSQRVSDEFGETKDMTFKVNGVSQTVADAFSGRHAEIKAYMREHGVDGQTAALATRNKKQAAMNYDALRETWAEKFKELEAIDPDGINLEAHAENILDAIPSDEHIIDLTHRFKHKVAINEFDIRTVINQCYTGHPNAEEQAEATFQRIINNEDLLCGLKPLDEIHNKQYCSMKLVEADLAIRSFAKRNEASREHELPPEAIEKEIEAFAERRGYRLSPEQENALRKATGPGSICAIVGKAGTGKSTVQNAICTSFSSQGFELIGTSVSNAAAENLQKETGITSHSTAKFLYDYDEGKLNITPKTVIFFDELGMASLEIFGRFAEIAERHGAKIICAGDPRQLSPVGSGGNALKCLLQAIDPSNRADLDDIRRQQRDEDKKLAVGFYDLLTPADSQRMYGDLTDAGYITAFDTQKAAIAKLAQDYVDHPAPENEKLVMASLVETVEALNTNIQKRLIEKGTVAPDPIKTVGAYTFHAGDCVRFTKSKKFGKTLKVINGTNGTVVPTTDGSLQVQLATGETVTVPDDFTGVGLRYARTIHRSQALSIDHCFAMIDGKAGGVSGIKNALGLVQFTRMKETISYYGETTYLEHFKNNLHVRDAESGAFELLDDQSRSNLKITKLVEHMNNIKSNTKTTKEELKQAPEETVIEMLDKVEEQHKNGVTISQHREEEKNVSHGTQFNYLKDIFEKYNLKGLDTGTGYDISFNEAKVIRVSENKDIAVSVASLSTNHAYDVVGAMVKNKHFDKTKPIYISVNENISSFTPELQQQAIEKMLDSLIESGIDTNKIVITNEAFKKLIEAAKVKRAMNITQDPFNSNVLTFNKDVQKRVTTAHSGPAEPEKAPPGPTPRQKVEQAQKEKREARWNEQNHTAPAPVQMEEQDDPNSRKNAKKKKKSKLSM
ncbi:MAG: MobF family relaxase [Rhodanobacter sp.]|jgi:conjugative relaxase-like TrwC/TraI family protein